MNSFLLKTSATTQASAFLISIITTVTSFVSAPPFQDSFATSCTECIDTSCNFANAQNSITGCKTKRPMANGSENSSTLTFQTLADHAIKAQHFNFHFC